MYLLAPHQPRAVQPLALPPYLRPPAGPPHTPDAQRKADVAEAAALRQRPAGDPVRRQVRRPRLRGGLRLRRHPQRAVRRVGPPPGHPMGRPALRLRTEMQPRLRLQHPLPRQVRAGQGGRCPHTEQVAAPRFLAGLCGAAVPPHPQKDRLRAVSGPRRRPARLQNLLLPRPAPLHSGLRGPQPWQAEILLL